jgi:hypothetical protein
LGQSPSGQDGILIGSQAPAQNNTLMNIRGANVYSVVHIKPIVDSSTFKNCPAWAGGVNTVCDLTIIGLSSTASNYTIEDDLVTSNLFLTDTHVGMYIVGEPVQKNGTTLIGYSRFTTSLSLPAWLVGTGAPSPSCSPGSLYSNLSGASAPTKTIYGCTSSGSWTPVQ